MDVIIYGLTIFIATMFPDIASANTPEASRALAETLLPYAIGAVGALLGALTAVLAWVGTQINARLTSLGTEMSKTNDTLTNIEKDLRGELTRLDRRVTRVETRCSIEHDED